MTSQNYIFKSGKEWGILSFMLYNVSGFIFFPSATDKTEGYKLLQLGADGSHRNEKTCKYNSSAETQRLSATLEM